MAEIEWRDAWKLIIDASRKTIINKDSTCSTYFDALPFQDDKMILFEKAIAFESLGNKKSALEYYKKAADEKEGLPVEHWRKRASYFLDRIENRGGFQTTDLNLLQPLRNIQWDVYFNIHYYANIDEYIRYLAISSVSRIRSEPAMAIVIFRTCLEIGLWTYFPKEVKEINEDYKRKHYSKDRKPRDIGLNDLLDELNSKHYKLLKGNEYTAYDKIRTYGNEAAHPGSIKAGKPFKYEDEELKPILDYFNQTMRFLNNHASQEKAE